jgi:hypothetical protein
VHARALITWIAIFPLVTLGFFAIAPFAGDWNPVLRAFVLSIVVVPVAVYIVVPQLMRVYGTLRARQTVSSTAARTTLTTASTSRAAVANPLSTLRLNLMRGGYLLMAVGLMIVKWPLLLRAASMPVMEGAVVCILTAVSLLAFLGLRYPVGMLPILLFEVTWKVLWLAIVALPHVIANDVDAATDQMLFSMLFVIPIIAVTPWAYAWKRFVTARGDRWARNA